MISEGTSSVSKKFISMEPCQFIFDNGVALIPCVESCFPSPDVSTASSFRFAQN